MIEKKLVKLLTKLEYTISFAESCTGGLLASSIISVNNSSKVINESFVTYSEESKMKRLGVKKETLDQFSVYSKEVAIEMAKGVASATNSTIGVGVTGVAGPSGGTKENPVGKVYFSIYDRINDKTYVFENLFNFKIRNKIRKEATKYILETIYTTLLK